MPETPATDPADAAAQVAAPQLPARFEPTEETPEPMPPSGGNWVRDADGGLSPADAVTAAAAGLRWPA